MDESCIGNSKFSEMNFVVIESEIMDFFLEERRSLESFVYWVGIEPVPRARDETQILIYLAGLCDAFA